MPADIGAWYQDVVSGKPPRLVWSHPLYAIFGQNSKSFALNPDAWLSLVHHDDRDATYKARRAGADMGAPYDIVYRTVLPDSSIRWIHEQAEAERNQENAIVRIIGTCQDVTEHATAQQASGLSVSLLGKAEAAARLGTYVFDARTGTWTSSPILDDIFGIDASYARTIESWGDLIHPDDRQDMLSYFQKEVLGKHHRFERVYRIIKQRDRQERWVQGFGDLELGTDGAVLQMIGTIQDITELKRLQESGERLVSIVESTPDFIGTATPDMKVIYMNDAFKRILPERYRADGTIPPGLSIEAFHPPETFAMLRDTAVPHAVRHGVWQGQSTMLDALGKEFPVLQTIIAHLGSDGKLVYLSTIARDISGLMEAQGTLKASEAEYRSLFDNMLDGFAYCEMIFKNGKPDDFTYLTVNGAFSILTGLKDVVGKKVTEILPDIKKSNPEIFELYGRVVLTGAQEHFEAFSPAFGGWLSVRAYRPEKGRFAAVFENITERKVAEMKVVRLNRVYAFLSQINQTIVHVNEREQLFRDICRIAISHGKFVMAWIGLIQPNGLILPAASDGRDDGFLAGTAHTGDPTEGKAFVVINDIARNLLAAPWRTEAIARGYRSAIALSLQSESKRIGTFNLYAAEANAFSEEEISLLQEVIRDINYAIDNIARGAKLIHTQQLERTNKVMVDRELKMMALKEEIADLKKQIASLRS